MAGSPWRGPSPLGPWPPRSLSPRLKSTCSCSSPPCPGGCLLPRGWAAAQLKHGYMLIRKLALPVCAFKPANGFQILVAGSLPGAVPSASRGHCQASTSTASRPTGSCSPGLAMRLHGPISAPPNRMKLCDSPARVPVFPALGSGRIQGSGTLVLSSEGEAQALAGLAQGLERWPAD